MDFDARKLCACVKVPMLGRARCSTSLTASNSAVQAPCVKNGGMSASHAHTSNTMITPVRTAGWGYLTKGAKESERQTGPTQPLHGMRGLIARESTGEVGLDLLLSLAAVLLGELHADADSALALVALRTLGRHPDDAPGDRQLLVLAHQVQQHEHFIAEPIVAVGRDEKAAVLHEGHVCEIQGTLVLDSEGQQTRLVCTRSHVSVPATQLCRPCIHPCTPLRTPLTGASRLKKASSANPLFSGTSSVARRSRTSSISPNSSRIFKNGPAPDK